jgi:hypothetical protein
MVIVKVRTRSFTCMVSSLRRVWCFRYVVVVLIVREKIESLREVSLLLSCYSSVQEKNEIKFG